MNHLYYGDKLDWLRDRGHFFDASVDLIYLDPPFNSNASYDVLFRGPKDDGLVGRSGWSVTSREASSRTRTAKRRFLL